MKEDIYSKLKKLLEENPTELDEYKLVYILSRIGKIVELKNIKKEYKFLWLYRNWALHCEIDDTKLLVDLGIFQSDDLNEREVLFMGHNQFTSELAEFALKQLGNKSYLDSRVKIESLVKLLDEILSDTPLIFRRVEKYTATLKNGNSDRYWEIKTAE